MTISHTPRRFVNRHTGEVKPGVPSGTSPFELRAHRLQVIAVDFHIELCALQPDERKLHQAG